MIGSAKLILYLGLVALASGDCKKSSHLTPEESAMLDIHNSYRALHRDTPPLCWACPSGQCDPEVEGDGVVFTPQNWADTIASTDEVK